MKSYHKREALLRDWVLRAEIPKAPGTAPDTVWRIGYVVLSTLNERGVCDIPVRQIAEMADVSQDTVERAYPVLNEFFDRTHRHWATTVWEPSWKSEDKKPGEAPQQWAIGFNNRLKNATDTYGIGKHRMYRVFVTHRLLKNIGDDVEPTLGEIHEATGLCKKVISKVCKALGLLYRVVRKVSAMRVRKNTPQPGQNPGKGVSGAALTTSNSNTPHYSSSSPARGAGKTKPKGKKMQALFNRNRVSDDNTEPRSKRKSKRPVPNTPENWTPSQSAEYMTVRLWQVRHRSLPTSRLAAILAKRRKENGYDGRHEKVLFELWLNSKYSQGDGNPIARFLASWQYNLERMEHILVAEYPDYASEHLAAVQQGMPTLEETLQNTQPSRPLSLAEKVALWEKQHQNQAHA